MGITVSFYRVAATTLQQLIAGQDEQAAAEQILQGYDDFPYSLHHLNLGKLYNLVEHFLNPTKDSASRLWRVFNGGTMLVHEPGVPPNEIYLGKLYYFDPQEVHRITRAMAEIQHSADTLHRYQLMMNIPSEEEALRHDVFPTYDDVVHHFLQLFCFFRIAEEAGDAMLRHQE